MFRSLLDLTSFTCPFTSFSITLPYDVQVSAIFLSFFSCRASLDAWSGRRSGRFGCRGAPCCGV